MLQADIERMRREHEMYIENSKSEFASRIDDERARSSSSNFDASIRLSLFISLSAF